MLEESLSIFASLLIHGVPKIKLQACRGIVAYYSHTLAIFRSTVRITAIATPTDSGLILQ